jgi:hypothetical protein
MLGTLGQGHTNQAAPRLHLSLVGTTLYAYLDSFSILQILINGGGQNMIHRLRVFHQMTAAEIQIKHKVASMKIFSEFPIMYDTLSTAYCSHNNTFV